MIVNFLGVYCSQRFVHKLRPNAPRGGGLGVEKRSGNSAENGKQRKADEDQ